MELLQPCFASLSNTLEVAKKISLIKINLDYNEMEIIDHHGKQHEGNPLIEHPTILGHQSIENSSPKPIAH